MTLFFKRNGSRAAFTLVELLIGMGVATVLTGGLALSSIAIQRGFWATQYQATSGASQQRILDYVARDGRNALGVTIENPGTTTGSKITLYVPDDYTAAGLPRDPIIVANAVVYNTSAARNRISYYLSGSNFIREVNGYPTVIATDVASFEPTFTAAVTSGVVTSIEGSIAFLPKFQRVATASSQAKAATVCQNRVALRNTAVLVAASTAPSGTPPPRRTTK